MTSAALICAAAASFLVGGGPRAPAALPRAGRIIAAIDYKDPAVAAEFQKVQERPIELVEAEIEKSGVPVPPSLNEMDMRLMLVELRMRKAGTMPGGGKAAPKKPASYGSKYEEALWEKPAFKRLIDDYRARGNTNALNLATEYLNSPRQAADRHRRASDSRTVDWRGSPLPENAHTAACAMPPCVCSASARVPRRPC